MRLERLEINGFKSFSDRAELAFDRGVAAIVGPNGCGKSNVADAITWVLGEQSARSLRGEKMEDVIFSGSDARKPTGAAEVRLRLSGVTSAAANGNGNGHGHDAGEDGEDPVRAVAREVELIRRLYRSGESEYLIDGAHCRLRDIHELLMDTGLGAKAYAIIEQGKIGMILSSRPTDRRQLIEEAAGITKYRARRRSAELKLDAAQQNLTRIDDIVFEVEKQRGTLKRQAAKARRYQRLRDELRRWEKVLFARRYRELGQAIESARGRLADARAREAAAAGRVAEVEDVLGRLRLELAEADGRAASARESAHAHELGIQRRQQQIELDRQQVTALAARASELEGEVASLEGRREPQRQELAARRDAAAEASASRDRASEALTEATDAYDAAYRGIEGLETEVEAARSAVFAASTTATTLRHAIEQAAAARERVAEALGRLDVEEGDLRLEAERVAAGGHAAEQGLAAAQQAVDASRAERAALEAALAAARAEREQLAQRLRGREQELAGLDARLASLEEMDAGRAGFTDAARALLAQANGAVEQAGAVADYLEVERGFERAVEAALGDLLQHVLVPSARHARTGVRLLREQGAGRCGFLVLDGSPRAAADVPAPHGLRALADVVSVTGVHGDVVRGALPAAWIAESFEAAGEAARATDAVVATLEGDVFRGSLLVSGGARADGRGILATRAEIKDLRQRVADGRDAVAGLAGTLADLDARVHDTGERIAACVGALHQHEKSIVTVEAQLARAREESGRLTRRGELLTTDRRRAEQERAQIDRRESEARESLARLDQERRGLDEQLAAAQRRLLEARETVEGLGRRVTEARAAHAALVERAAAAAADVARLEDAARELETRVTALRGEHDQKIARHGTLQTSIAEGLSSLDADVRAFDELRDAVRLAEEEAAALRARTDEQEARIREARAALDTVRAAAAELEVSRATAESDLAHLAASCAETVQASLDEVLAEVEQLERDGLDVPDARAIAADEPDEAAEDEGRAPPADEAPVDAPPASLTAEGAITALRAKIDRLGPVNMMAIEQFEELEGRHAFLTTQRKDLVDSIAATTEAIRRIDETSRVRFQEAFSAINANFQGTFSTLFGGGRAGITLIDESDPLESGIDIVASPPGKRLQSVQLLSGGEKALTAIALMFAIFKYKPSPFCLLDEIDAPLDDANIGRFVEMLKGLLHDTQFILITHNRKTMEIADRLYGVTMEEPGVSKLISVRLN